jgi:hypothetical protein
VPTTRVKLSHDLPRVQPRAQRGAPPRPTSGLGLSIGLGRRSLPCPTSGLVLGRRSPPCPTPGLDLSLGLGRSHILSRPRPRPQEKSSPRPTSASDRLRYRGYIITLLLASCLRLQRNKTGVPSKVTPVTGNDGSPRAPMTSIALNPLRKQGNVSRIHAAPPAMLRQGSRHFSDSHVSTRAGLKALLRQPR